MAARARQRWANDPVAFASEVLGIDLWERQADLLRAAATHRFVACRSGHKVGKSTGLAALALWFLVTRQRSRVVLTAPSSHQIQNIIWAEVRRLYARAAERGFPLGGECFGTPWVGLKLPDGRDMFGLSTDAPERFAGISGANLLFVVDEASGIAESIFEAIFGNAAGGATVVLISNPTRTAGTFYDAFHGKRDGWFTLHIASTETPNFHGQTVPGLATPEWVTWAKGQWGEHSPYFDVRVLGNFPAQSENAVIGLSLVEDGMARGRLLVHAPDPLDTLCLGIDVARYGDDETVFAPRRGLRVYPLEVLRSMDSGEVAGRARNTLRRYARPDEVPDAHVDVIGVGAGVFDVLAEVPHVHTLPVNVAERAEHPDKYDRLRSQLWFQVRDWLRAGGALPDDERLAAELVAPTYSVDPKGRLCVESKDRIKEALKRSPDRADAVCLAVHGFAGAWSGVASGAGVTLDELRRLLPQRRLSSGAREFSYTAEDD